MIVKYFVFLCICDVAHRPEISELSKSSKALMHRKLNNSELTMSTQSTPKVYLMKVLHINIGYIIHENKSMLLCTSICVFFQNVKHKFYVIHGHNYVVVLI